MAFLRFTGFQREFLEEQSELFAEEFSRVAHLPRERVSVELLGLKPITDTPRSLEILMFPREKKVYDEIAEMLNALLCHFGFPDVHLFFVLLQPSLYYQEGRPFAAAEA
ncbi:DUF1904 family protein [Geomesophilobacter sediminis]|uniref:DUF1904 family protein n=1 Tax=Geomesophilobacter sediminis TaxID=2798584 RepID=A0A8J7IQQ8_9BACT|nr:DUF1904 family protein [Geomesophilobacter sediminis]MBJ6725044.1 DUF1904 family protein [Geomesophilobacter sediminis]